MYLDGGKYYEAEVEYCDRQVDSMNAGVVLRNGNSLRIPMSWMTLRSLKASKAISSSKILYNVNTDYES
jgi:hypothetical protein